MALAEKTKKSGAVVVVFMGDGTLGEGVIYEAFNMASLWQLPILNVVENNHIAQTTPTSMALAGSIRQRFEAFDIPCTELDTSVVQLIKETVMGLLHEVREQTSPRALVLNTARFGPHSKSDDTRSEAELATLKTTRDPLTTLAKLIPEDTLKKIHEEVEAEVKTAFSLALADDPASWEDASA